MLLVKFNSITTNHRGRNRFLLVRQRRRRDSLENIDWISLENSSSFSFSFELHSAVIQRRLNLKRFRSNQLIRFSAMKAIKRGRSNDVEYQQKSKIIPNRALPTVTRPNWNWNEIASTCVFATPRLNQSTINHNQPCQKNPPTESWSLFKSCDQITVPRARV